MLESRSITIALETLSTIKNPPTIIAKQANIAHGPQQVNSSQVSAMRASEKESEPKELLEASHEKPMDCGSSRKKASGDLAMETAAADKAKHN